MIKFLDLSNDEKECQEIINAFVNVLNAGNYILGEYSKIFEKSISSCLGVSHCVSVNSGYDALKLSLIACGVNAGDEIITVANTFVATVSAIVELGAIPKLVDVDATRNISPSEIEKQISHKTKAILVVHLAGIPCEMDAICNIAKKYGLLIIEDAAQAFGTKYKDRYVGTFGVCGCFSLHPTKVLGGCGDGGMIVTNDAKINSRLRLLRNHGLYDRDTCNEFGFNSRLDELQACFLLEKLKSVSSEIETRRKYAALYKKELNDIKCISMPLSPDDSYETYFTFTILAEDRDRLKDFLRIKGVDTRIHYPIPINHQKAYSSLFGELDLRNTDYQAAHILSLPCNGHLSVDDVLYIIACIKEFV